MKKGLLIASLASVTAVAGGLAFAVANANNGIRFEAAKAETKAFALNQNINLPGISKQELNLRSSLPIEFVHTEYSGYTTGNGIHGKFLSSQSTQDRIYVSDDTNNYFFRSDFQKDWVDGYVPVLSVEIGVNNLTSLTWYTKTSGDFTATLSTHLHLYSESVEILDKAYTNGGFKEISSISDFLVSEGKEVVKIDKVIVDVQITDLAATLTPGHFFGFQYINGTWSC